MKKYLKKEYILILGIIILSIITLNGIYHNELTKKRREVNAKILANLPYDTKNYVYLSDLEWESAESSWKDARALKKDENEPGDLISLIVNNEKTYFLKGIFAHAQSTVIYDLTNLNYDTFESYVGLDSTRNSLGNGVKFYIYVSNDKQDWILREETNTLKGNLEAVKLTVDISGYKYLKLFASNLGNQDSDHAVYADAKLYNRSTYTPNTNTKVDFIKEVSDYDKELAGKSASDIVNSNDLELTLLQRNLVKKVSYPILQAFATSDDYKKETIDWLFHNKNVLKAYTTGGEPLGNYVKSLTVLSNLYHTYSNDLTSNNRYTEEQRNVFLKMMLSISLTHSGTIAFWTSGANNTLVLSNPIKRYEVFKNLYLNENLTETYTQSFNKDVFESLTVEEMRWVVDARLSDEELPWLNWYTSENFKNTKYYGTEEKPRNSMDPYTYIWYNASFEWEYTNENYYKENSTWCAADINTPGNTGYQRGANCENLYHTKEWGIKSDTNTQPRLWVVWEEDGVCGALSKTGENLNNSYGQVAAVTRQPGHAAYLVQNKTKQEDGTYNVTWSIGNDVHGWAKSSGTEKGERLPLNWGTTTLDYSSDYNASYVILAQRAIDDFANYEKALEYKLLADIYENEPTKQEELYRAIVGYPTEGGKNTGGLQYFNLDGWYGLIKSYLRNEAKTPEDYNNLADELINNLEEFPLAMHDMLNLILDKLGVYTNSIENAENTTLKKLSEVQNNSQEYKQGQAVRQVAQYLLGQKEEVVKFSFDGENANKIVLTNPQPFEYSLDYSYDTEAKEVHANWTLVSDSQIVDLTKDLDKITVDKDIVIHFTVDNDKTPTSNSVVIINIEKDKTPTNLYANDLENKVLGVTDTMEWQIVSKGRSANNWTKFSEAEPDLSNLTTILVREGAHGTYLPSDTVEFTFEADPEADPTKVYIPISRLEATASTSEKASEDASKAIDGRNNTMWHTKWNGSDNDKWISIHIKGGAVISELDYMPRQDGSANGRITKARIETSMDGETWTLIEDNIEWTNDSSTKTYFFKNPTRANYVRLTGVETQGPGSYASAAMINLFENTVNTKIDVDTLNISYIETGYTYNGSEHTPSITVKEDNTELIANEQYTVSYENNVNAGTANIKITGMGIYKGTTNKPFTISKATSPESEPIEQIFADTNQNKLEDIDLPEGWSWEKPETTLKQGKTTTAKAIYHDQNNYENYIKEISITKIVGIPPYIDITEEAKAKGYTIDNNYKLAIEFNYDTDKDQGIDLEYFKKLITIYDAEDHATGKEVQVTYENDFKWEIGTYHIYVTATDSDGNETTLDIEVSIHGDRQLNIANYNVTILEDEFIYTGNPIEPTITVTDENNHTLTPETDYTVSYDYNVNVTNLAVIKITGKGIYTGTINRTFEIKKVPIPEKLPEAKIVVSKDTTSINDISLPEGWNWENKDIVLEPGRNVLKVIYLGDENHESYEFEITIIRGEDNTPEPTPTPSNPNDNDKPNTGDNNNNPSDNKPNNNPDDKTPTDNNQNTNSSTNPPKEEVPNTYDHILSSVSLLLLSILTLGLSTRIISIKKVS